jgi:hypothetical protein
MIRYNKLKLRVLSLFESAGRDWLGPSEAAEMLNFLPARGVDLLQKIVEIWLTGEMFDR